MLNTQSGNMLSILTDTINSAAGRVLELGPGTFVIDAANPSLPLADYTNIRGSGRGNTILEFRNLNSTSHGLTATNKTGIRISGLTLKAATALTANQNALNFEACNDCIITDCDQINFSGGFWFTYASGPDNTWNLRNKAVNCISRNSQSYGLFINGGTACEWRGCEAYNAANQDGFKTGRGSRFLRIVDCHAQGNNQDGFDTYDGFISSTMSNCTSVNNTAAGFQFKGTFGGSYSAGDYVTRDSAVSNCIAVGNGIQGFLFQECRSLVLTNLTASENVANGFVFNDTQCFTATGLLAIRNALDGFNLQGGTSRSTFNGCIAQDNSYVDGTVQNGSHDGFNLVLAGSNNFNGCFSLNGTQSGKVGGQGYGFNVNPASIGNVFTAKFGIGNTIGTDGTR